MNRAEMSELVNRLHNEANLKQNLKRELQIKTQNEAVKDFNLFTPKLSLRSQKVAKRARVKDLSRRQSLEKSRVEPEKSPAKEQDEEKVRQLKVVQAVQKETLKTIDTQEKMSDHDDFGSSNADDNGH